MHEAARWIERRHLSSSDAKPAPSCHIVGSTIVGRRQMSAAFQTTARNFPGRAAGFRTRFNGPIIDHRDANDDAVPSFAISPPCRPRAPRQHRGPFPERTPAVAPPPSALSVIVDDAPPQQEAAAVVPPPQEAAAVLPPQAGRLPKESPGAQRRNLARRRSSSNASTASTDLAAVAHGNDVVGVSAGTSSPTGSNRVTPTQQRKGNTSRGGGGNNGPNSPSGSNRGTPTQQRKGFNSSSRAAPAPMRVSSSPTAPKTVSRPWYGADPHLETRIPQLLQKCNNSPPQEAAACANEVRTLLTTAAETDAAITQFYLGVAVGVLEGEEKACEHYERALKQLPLLHNARNNLIRGLMKRGSPSDQKQALEHANLSAGLQPEVAEMQYQLGVVLMQQSQHEPAASAYERTLALDPKHAGAFVNGVHCLQLLPPSDRVARKRLEKLARMAVAAGMWTTWLQRPPHLVRKLRSTPWWDKRDFPWAALLERNYPAIREEVLRLRNGDPASFTPVGGRAAHDHTLVAAGEWKEFPLFGNGIAYEDNCRRCPATAGTMQHVQPAIELAFAGGGETLFSTLKPGTHLRPHCGSTNTRLTAHLGVVVPKGCSIRCGDEWREWKEGEVLVFDDSWEHEVKHEGAEDRVVLLINFWHPGLAPEERKIELDTYGYKPI